MIFAIDPGTTESGWCMLDKGALHSCGILPNQQLLDVLAHTEADLLAIEMVACYGMPVGKETFETVLWAGRFIQACPQPHRLVYRKEVKLHLCGSMRAKDPNIRQALLDKLGPVGTKKTPGPLLGVKSHIWSALAIAVTAAETPTPMERAA